MVHPTAGRWRTRTPGRTTGVGGSAAREGVGERALELRGGRAAVAAAVDGPVGRGDEVARTGSELDAERLRRPPVGHVDRHAIGVAAGEPAVDRERRLLAVRRRDRALEGHLHGPQDGDVEGTAPGLRGGGHRQRERRRVVPSR